MSSGNDVRDTKPIVTRGRFTAVDNEMASLTMTSRRCRTSSITSANGLTTIVYNTRSLVFPSRRRAPADHDDMTIIATVEFSCGRVRWCALAGLRGELRVDETRTRWYDASDGKLTGIIARARAADPRNRTSVMRNPVIRRNPRCKMAAFPVWRPEATDAANVGD